jgi:hypothetical protein
MAINVAADINTPTAAHTTRKAGDSAHARNTSIHPSRDGHTGTLADTAPARSIEARRATACDALCSR